MAPAINFFAGGASFAINNLSGSGLGFYGQASFGSSINVGSYNQRTFITDSTGTVQGQEVNNVQYLNVASGILGQGGSGIGLQAIPNTQSSLNVRFTNDTPCKTQGAQVIIFDRTTVTSAASGVTTQVAQLIHPATVQGPGGSGDTAWTKFNFQNGGSALNLANSPGTSGFSPNGVNTTDVQHDWYLAISASPDTIGSKTLYGLYISLQYL